jgi:hypothetical protein
MPLGSVAFMFHERSGFRALVDLRCDFITQKLTPQLIRAQRFEPVW